MVGSTLIEYFPPYNPPTYDFPFDIWTAKVIIGTYALGEQQGASMYGIAGSPIPEPSTLLLLGVGFLGFGLFGRWRRNN